ncbi:plastocyanin/azurin family copper-binding protein [Hoeflea sp. G2-23]|uniref:Plastocyanin/azurin family copper-binding protein n=1 Tax=Hoeflea algicola TaxID=2983763 RepID=A0ABT3ZG19_9HYPH|nr:plastocyanin/azurin family copper-binding protein [Hoeflea algicola]MCY0150556.1 plastocyanin/azurin family copper-binding protein [Hoeflea algicola]
MENAIVPRSFRLRVLPLLLGALLIAPLPGFAQDAAPNEVRLMDKGPDGTNKVFVPAIMRIEVGGDVNFVAWDFGHDLTSVDGLAPAGAAPFKGYKNADTNVVFEKEGVYVVQCAAHKEIGMVGIVVAGDPSVNLDDIIANYPTNAALSEGARARLGVLLETLKSE